MALLGRQEPLLETLQQEDNTNLRRPQQWVSVYLMSVYGRSRNPSVLIFDTLCVRCYGLISVELVLLSTPGISCAAKVVIFTWSPGWVCFEATTDRGAPRENLSCCTFFTPG
jgi:hypothetical protein